MHSPTQPHKTIQVPPITLKPLHLWLECIAIFGGVPLLFVFNIVPMRLLMLTIIGGGLLTAFIGPRLPASAGLNLPPWSWWHASGLKQQIKPMLIGFSCSAIATALLMLAFKVLQAQAWLFLPEQIHWFALPRQRPVLWLVIMCVYPLVSVYPQELIYRGFFCRRYETIFNTRTKMITANAVAFGWVHIIFLNPMAVILTTFGGAIFCATYLRRGSLGAAWLEHTLYGCWVFTLGFGWWFYGGSVSSG